MIGWWHIIKHLHSQYTNPSGGYIGLCIVAACNRVKSWSPSWEKSTQCFIQIYPFTYGVYFCAGRPSNFKVSWEFVFLLLLLTGCTQSVTGKAWGLFWQRLLAPTQRGAGTCTRDRSGDDEMALIGLRSGRRGQGCQLVCAVWLAWTWEWESERSLHVEALWRRRRVIFPLWLSMGVWWQLITLMHLLRFFPSRQCVCVWVSKCVCVCVWVCVCVCNSECIAPPTTHPCRWPSADQMCVKRACMMCGVVWYGSSNTHTHTHSRLKDQTPAAGCLWKTASLCQNV